MKIRIRAKLMLGATAGVLAVVGVVSFAAYRIARKGMLDSILSHLESVAQSRAAHVETYLDDHKQTVRLVATSIILADGLRNLKANAGDSASIVRKLNARLKVFIDAEKDIDEIFLLDGHGRVVASTAPERIGLDRSLDAYFLGAQTSPFIKDAYHSAITEEDSLACAAPLFDRPGGDLLGVLVLRFDMAELSAITTDRTGLGKTGETYLINKHGFMITPSKFQEDTFLKLRVDTENARDCLAEMDAMRREKHPDRPEWVAKTFLGCRGVPVLGAHAPLPEMEWGLLAEIGAGEAFAPVARLRRTNLTTGAVFAALALVAAWFFARLISRPIHELQVGAERIAAGELHHRVEIRTGDEIEQLAHEFNRMAARLSESYASLEQKVAERTADLTKEIAERKRAEKEIGALKKQMEFILGATKTGIDIIDSEFNIRYIDPEWQKVYGDPAGRKCHEYFMDRDEVCPGCGIVKALETKEVIVTQELLVKENNRPIQVTTMPFQNDQGEWLVAEVNTDIAERARAEEALRASEERLRLALSAAEMGTWRWVPATNQDTRDGSFNRILGLEPVESTQPVEDFLGRLHSEDRAAVEKAIQSACDEHRPYLAEFRIVRPDGQVRWLRDQGKGYYNRTGETYMTGAVVDITDRKQAEEALKESEERYRSLADDVLDTSAVGIFILDADFKIVWVNRSLERYFGVRRDEIVGRDKRTLIRERIKDIFENPERFAGKVFATYDDNTYVENFQCRVLPDGEREARWLEHWSQPIRSGLYAGGRIEHYYDITDRKRAEEQLRQYAADLKRANEEVRQFAYIVSHDLRSPLVNLKGFSAELRSALEVFHPVMDAASPHLNEKQKAAVSAALERDVPEALHFIDSSVTRMGNFIDAVLKLSRVGHRKLHIEPIDMDALVRAALDALAHQIEQRGVKVTVGMLPTVEADRVSMEQIMTNLLTNAVNYLDPARPGEIEIAGGRGRDATTFRVRDNGRGIAEEDMDKVFAPFRRAGRQDVQGEGMGLAYVQALVRRHGGHIGCESEAGAGTTFTFTISNYLSKGGDRV